MGDLKITTRKIDDILIMDLEGNIQLGETSSALHRELKELVDDGERNIVINLAAVAAIDSSGLGSLIAGYATLEKNDGSLKLLNLSSRAMELMTITKLLTVFEIFESESDALASFGNAGSAPAAREAGGSSLL